ncbi:50S ribosomal protein L11 methyltransferase [Brachyspira catarrhinii]|uniref:Methyltransferase domain-containing protein n=1 Tax=Brachyspira catarrhinii TaxID=2528966 RepID=A0ABY2TTF3_9SPIR|nr:50S ribosomal protein L11 methyltransferase [Brachyspira catarrhinii]TKZ36085.1 methyltransferase domain-containing protein [Brachyspira catarrhinii]
MKLYSLSFKVDFGFEDILEAIIESGKLDILGYNIEYPKNDKKENIAIVNIYNENNKKLENNLNIIKNYLEIDYSYEIKELDSDKYLTSYMEYLKPFKIGNITIVPNLKDYKDYYNNLEEPIIYIAKQYAFGSGTHETTYLALETINEYSLENDIKTKSIADIGCGSGILSLFSYKLGARNIFSVDIDSDAVNCSLDNAKYNDINLDNVIFGSSKDLNNMNLKFDLVVANIETDILIEIMSDLKKLLKENSCLILSGILLEKESYINNAIREHGLKIINRKRKNDWVVLLLSL